MVCRAQVNNFIPAQNRLGECPLWDDTADSLVWIDLHEGRVQSSNGNGHMLWTASLDQRIGSVALTHGRELLVARGQEFVYLDPESQVTTSIAEVPDLTASVRLNDGRVDRAGRFVSGSMDEEKPRKQVSGVFQLSPDGSVGTLVDGITMSNSICFSITGRTLYHADMPTRCITAYRYDSDEGRAYSPEIFADLSGLPGSPDGSVVDAEGFVWNALFGGGRLVRLDPAGRVDRTVELPITNPTCGCFGGSDLGTLFVTSARAGLGEAALAAEPWAGDVLAVDVGVCGLAEGRFGDSRAANHRR